MDINEGVEKTYNCPNQHPVHDTCLAEWLLHSPKCSLCNRDYDSYLIAKSKDFIEQKAKEKNLSVEEQMRMQKRTKIEKIAEKMVFLKQVDAIENLIEQKEYDKALEELNVLEGQNLSKDKRFTVSFLKGKTFYFKGRYDMAISHLLKVIRENYEFPEVFLYLGKSYEKLGLTEKAKWAFDSIR
jgi:tetratricopeptide (TPR) repeat protein